MAGVEDNIFAGTQVVTQIEVLGSNRAIVHPRGAVGLVTRTPAVPSEGYLVRFPDGFESTLRREDLAVLKHFKEQLGGGGGDDFDLESLVIYQCITGSRAFGLEHAGSDTDRRGIYQAPNEMLWSILGAPEQFEDNTAQICHWELRKFVVMALKASPNVLECLYSPLVERVTPVGQALLDRRHIFLSRLIFQTFSGYAVSQFKKIEQDVRTRGEVRWKHAMHLLRLLISGMGALREGRIPVRVEAHRDRLLAIKSGAETWESVDAWRLELLAEMEAAFVESKLPDRPDYEAANAFLIEARLRNCPQA